MTAIAGGLGREPAANTRGLRIALGYEAALTPTAGIGRYTRDLYEGLLLHSDVAEVRRFANFRWFDDQADEAEAETASRANRRRLDAAFALAQSVPGGQAARRWLRDRVSRKFLAPAAGLDLYHEPNFVPRASDLPTVISVHDLGIYLYPEYHPPGRVEHLVNAIPAALKSADHVITISALVREQIMDRFGTPAEKISVVPIGLNRAFSPRTREDCASVLTRAGLEWKRYLLFVGTLEPRKNLESVLDGLDRLPRAVVDKYPLVVVGGEGWQNERLLQRLQSAASDGRVVRIGHTDDATLACLYAAACGLVFVSHYEGQGLPAIEAAATGTPVLATNDSAMAEQLGGLGRYCDANDVSGIADGMQALIDDESLARKAGEAAATIRDRFSMTRCVDATVGVYKRVLEARAAAWRG